MLKSIPLNIVSRLLLLVMLTVAINCISESSHAMQGHLFATGDHAEHVGNGESQQGPDTPSEHHQDHDCCDSCSNCATHAPLTNQMVPIMYNPLITDQQFSEPFKHFSEVFLPKFIPPQNRI